MPHNVSIPLTQWRAHACKAAVCPQLLQAPSIRHLLMHRRTRLWSYTGLPLLHRSSFAPAMLPVSTEHRLKMHR
jgi:hypothetical protein